MSPFKRKAMPGFCIINRPFSPPVPKAYLEGQAFEDVNPHTLGVCFPHRRLECEGSCQCHLDGGNCH